MMEVSKENPDCGARKRAVLEEWRTLAGVLSRRDGRLEPLIRMIGEPKLRLQENPFRALAEAIISQQLAPKAAQAIIARVSALSPPFPNASEIGSMSVPKLRKAGLSSAKTSYLRELARFWTRRQWRRGWDGMSDDELIERLTEVRGIGTWTAHMFLIFSLGRPNILPVGDYGIRRGLQLLFRTPEVPLPKEIPHLVGHWEGAYSIGCWYLWEAMDREILRS